MVTFQAHFQHFCFFVILVKDKKQKYATSVTTKKILKIGISQFRFHQNVQVEFVY